MSLFFWYMDSLQNLYRFFTYSFLYIKKLLSNNYINRSLWTKRFKPNPKEEIYLKLPSDNNCLTKDTHYIQIIIHDRKDIPKIQLNNKRKTSSIQ